MRGLYTIDPEYPFLPALAAGLVQLLGDRLPSALVLLPSRRACVALRDSFLAASDGAAMLLPRMQPVGEAGSEALLFTDEPLPDAIDPLRRKLLLAKLVRQQRATQGGVTDEHAIRLAGELADFLDEMQTEEVSLDRLSTLVDGELATHWQQILVFLRILGDVWPHVLAEEGGIDPPQRRRLQLDAVVDNWRTTPPGHPVIAAGMTGTIPAVGRLVAAVARLEEGAVVLPGLDRDMDDASWDAVARTPAHPQHGLCRLLSRLEADRALVRSWPDADGCKVLAGRTRRRRLLSEIMRPAATSEAWKNVTAPSAQALDGMARAEVPTFADEAVLLSLRIREQLEHPGRTVALVTSDRTLARRVAVELERYGIDADDTAGTPLDQTPPGSFLLLSARAIIEDLTPVPLLSLLKHPLASGHDERGRFRRHVRALERGILRGPRLSGGFSGYLAAIRDADERHWPSPVAREDLAAWFERIEVAARPLSELAGRGEAGFPELVEAHLAFAEWLACDGEGVPDELWARETGAAASSFFMRLREAVADFPPIAPSAYPALLAVLMGAEAVRSHATRHPRVSILGQLESRLVSADRMLIAGLNEGVWPRAVNPSPWINRAMRAELGLPPAEMQIGIAAHDLVMAASSPECLLSRSRKDHAGAPTSPSRWLARLDAVLRAGGREGAIDLEPHWLEWAGDLDRPQGPVSPCPRPIPAPPLEARPAEAYVTEIETLIRDPYAYYARKILELSSLDPLDADPGHGERGEIVHRALDEFVRSWPHELPERAEEELLAIGERTFSAMQHHPQVRAIWWPRFVDIANWFVSEERKRRERIERILAESRGDLDIELKTGRFRLRARADRVEIDDSGHFNIIDYKTGRPPNQKNVAQGISPQLTLSALIAEGGGFDQGTRLPTGELLYWALKGGENGNEMTALKDVAELVGNARIGLERLIEWYRDPENGYPAVPRPEIAPVFNDYEHLARIDEWRGSSGDEEEGAE
ncbi:MAG: double-strand break repair protein AddB [Geminicoccaceae bacterium]